MFDASLFVVTMDVHVGQIVSAAIPGRMPVSVVTPRELARALSRGIVFAALVDARILNDGGNAGAAEQTIIRALADGRICGVAVYHPHRRDAHSKDYEWATLNIHGARDLATFWPSLRSNVVEWGLLQLLIDVQERLGPTHRLSRAIYLAVRSEVPFANEEDLAPAVQCSVNTLTSDLGKYAGGDGGVGLHELLSWIALLRWIGGRRSHLGARRTAGPLARFRSRLYRLCKGKLGCTLKAVEEQRLPDVIQAFALASGIVAGILKRRRPTG